MRQAAVGFQCPSCVKEGARSTRSGRTTYGGLRRGDPSLTSKVLIGLNLLVYALVLATGGSARLWIERLALMPLGRCGSIAHPAGFYPGVGQAVCSTIPGTRWLPGVADGAYWQLVTSMFTHVEIWHIGFNMVALWVLGPQLEAALGRVRFLAVYLLSGLVGSALVYWLSGPHSSTLGASGALFGLMGALLVIALKVRADVSTLLVWIGLNFVITVVGRGFISWEGHLGGFVGGVVCAAVLAWAPRRGRTGWQTAGLGAVAVLVALAVALRTLTLG